MYIFIKTEAILMIKILETYYTYTECVNMFPQLHVIQDSVS